MRVYEFARKYGKTSKEIISLCHELGIEVKAAQSVLKEDGLILLNNKFDCGKDAIEVFEQAEVKEAVKVKAEVKIETLQSETVEQTLYVVTECVPFTTLGQLGETAYQFAKEHTTTHSKVIVTLPKYQCIADEVVSKMELVKTAVIKVGWREQVAELYKLEQDAITFYFVAQDSYFNREEIYGYADDAERFAFFNRAVLELLPLVETHINHIQVNDWHTSLVPLLLNIDYSNQEFYTNAETTLNIHDLQYQGWFEASVLTDVVGISHEYFDNGLTRMGNAVNFLKSGIVTATNVKINELIREQMNLPEIVESGMTAILQSKISA